MNTLIAIIILLGVLIFFHELGHFVVAKFFGVGVEKFSLGFGPKIFGKKIGLTEYRLSAFPLGGYVKMIGEEPDAEIDSEKIHLSFTHKHVLKRILIVSAGPVFNFFLAAFIFFSIYYFSGVTAYKPIIKKVLNNTSAYEAGFRDGDFVKSINGAPVENWSDMLKIIRSSNGKNLEFTILRDNTSELIDILPSIKTTRNIFGEEEEIYDIGISLLPPLKPIVGSVVKDYPAGNGGLQSGDRITSINGNLVETWEDMTKIIARSKGQPLDMTVSRDGSELNLKINPILKKEKDLLGNETERYLIGISAPAINPDDLDIKYIKKMGIVASFSESVGHTFMISGYTILSIVKLVQGKLSTKALGGPIMIAQMAGDQAKEGMKNFLSLMAFISISLAIFNLLPIPVLDGGHLLFYTIEVFIRRPVNIRTREIAQQIGVSLLLLLMVYVTWNDIMRNMDTITGFFNNIKQAITG